jgi:hypothetical protein
VPPSVSNPPPLCACSKSYSHSPLVAVRWRAAPQLPYWQTGYSSQTHHHHLLQPPAAAAAVLGAARASGLRVAVLVRGAPRGLGMRLLRLPPGLLQHPASQCQHSSRTHDTPVMHFKQRVRAAWQHCRLCGTILAGILSLLTVQRS